MSNAENLAQDTVNTANNLAKTIVSNAQNLVNNTSELVDKTQSTFTNVVDEEKKTLTDDADTTINTTKKVIQIEPIENEIENKLQTITKKVNLDKEDDLEIKKI